MKLRLMENQEEIFRIDIDERMKEHGASGMLMSLNLPEIWRFHIYRWKGAQIRGKQIMSCDLSDKFFHLLAVYYKENRTVKFYADKLNITSKYLTTAIKKATGRPVLEWLHEAVLIEAKMLLKTTDLTVQEISDRLYFSSPSAFVQFFKKHTGTTPKKIWGNSWRRHEAEASVFFAYKGDLSPGFAPYGRTSLPARDLRRRGAPLHIPWCSPRGPCNKRRHEADASVFAYKGDLMRESSQRSPLYAKTGWLSSSGLLCCGERGIWMKPPIDYRTHCVSIYFSIHRYLKLHKFGVLLGNFLDSVPIWI